MNQSESVDFDFFDTPRNEVSESTSLYNRSNDVSAKTAKPPRGKQVAENNIHGKGSEIHIDTTIKGGRDENDYSDDDYSSDSSSSFESDSETPRMKGAPAKSSVDRKTDKSRGKMMPNSPESSSAYSDSESDSEDEIRNNRNKAGKSKANINVVLPKTVQAWGTEEKTDKKVEKRRNCKQSEYTSNREDQKNRYLNRKGNSESDSDSSREREHHKEKSRSKHTRDRNGHEKSDKHKRQPLKSASSSHSNNSDITDVSPLESPDVSPREARKKYDNVQYGTKADTEADIRLETDKIDLSILMKCMADIDREKQQRLKNNSRRVMFAPPSLNDKQRANYTFSSSRAKMIERENQRLLEQIMVHVKPGTKKLRPGSATRTLPKKAVEPVIQRLTPSAVNRQREQRKIEMENMVYVFVLTFSIDLC